jgi:hypothetical protein
MGWHVLLQPGDESSIARMISDCPAVLETTLEEERRTLPVEITAAGSGLAFFRSHAWSKPTDRPGRSSSHVSAPN